MNIENTQECFVQLWLRLGRTRRLLTGQHKRFCIRNLLRSWFGLRATEDFIWEVVHRIDLDDEDAPCGYDELPPPALYPRKHRELLRAIVSVRLGISYYRIPMTLPYMLMAIPVVIAVVLGIAKGKSYSTKGYSIAGAVLGSVQLFLIFQMRSSIGDFFGLVSWTLIYTLYLLFSLAIVTLSMISIFIKK